MTDFNGSPADGVSRGYVSGLKTEQIGIRLEIDEFILDKNVLNLFLIAIDNIQKKPYQDPWSWFQISGIHGRPHTNWNDVEFGKPNWAGYCSHSSVTFPTWHRPYVAMIEQAVYVEMVEVANSYTDETWKTQYLEAAERFRFPYWDPCSPRQLKEPKPEGPASPTLPYEFGIPVIVSTPNVFVRKPHNPAHLEAIPNPLYQYKFPKEFHYPHNPGEFWDTNSGNALLDDPSLKGKEHTVRAPKEDGQTDDAYINAYLWRHMQSDVGSSLFKLLTAHEKWIEFSNDVFDREEAAEAEKAHKHYVDATLEGFHDSVHVFLGQGRLGTGREEKGSGHIADPSYAAFDPIFWLHHVNVDRLTAIWQAQQDTTKLDSWWADSKVHEANWNSTPGAKLTPEDGLTPFRQIPRSGETETFWTSDSVRDWSTFGYTYEAKYVVKGESGNELATTLIQPEGTDRQALNTFINQFYGWTDLPFEKYPSFLSPYFPINISKVDALTGKEGPEKPISLPTHPDRASKDKAVDPLTIDYGEISEHLLEGGNFKQWSLRILAEKFALNKSYQIFVFLGPFKDDKPDQWPCEPNLVGINGIFANTMKPGACSNCESQADSKLTVMDVIPLTRHLIKWIKSKEACPKDDPAGIILEDLSYEHVKAFLLQNLHWRVADMNLYPFREECTFAHVQAVERIIHLPKRYDECVGFGETKMQDKASASPAPAPAPGNQPASSAPAAGYEEKPAESGCCGGKCVIQ